MRAYLDTKDYPLKVKPSAQRLRELRITRHTTLPKWNYTMLRVELGYETRHLLGGRFRVDKLGTLLHCFTLINERRSATIVRGIK